MAKGRKVFSIEYIAAQLGVGDFSTDEIAAIHGAASPSAANPFATMADVGGGSGDMTKAVYDTDNDGVVDDSELLSGNNAAYYLSRANHTGTQTAATISDFTAAVAAAETDPVFTAWLAGPPNVSVFTNDAGYITAAAALSSSTSSVQDGYFGDIYLIDDTTPAFYLKITNEQNLTANRTLSITTNDASRTISLSGNLTVSATADVSGTNTGDQTSIVGITGTKDQFNTAVTDGDFLFSGDVTQYTDEMAQDAVGGMVANSTFVSLTYVDGTPSLTAALSATGTPGATTYLRGDNTWSTVSASLGDGDYGDVVISSSGAVMTVESASKSFGFTGVVTDTTSSGSLDDYTMTGLADATELRFNTGAALVNLRSLQGGYDGRIITIRNVDPTTTMTILNDAGTGSASNKFYCHATIVLTQYYGVTFKYNGALSRWVLLNSDLYYGSSATDLLGSMVQPTIATNRVTYAKMQDVTATQRVIGRNTAGAGDPEEVTAAQFMDWLGTTAGHTPFRDGSGWTTAAKMNYLQLTGDQTSTSTALADITGLASFSTEAGATYYFMFDFTVTTNATTVGILCTINHSTAVTSIRFNTQYPTSATAYVSEEITALDGGTLPTAGPGSTRVHYRMSGFVTINTAGTLAARFRSETGAAVVVKSGSYGYITRVA